MRSPWYCGVLFALVILCGSQAGRAQGDLEKLSPFGELASTPSRLTMFNAHDDARQGAYNCSQERDVIEAALKQTRAFLTLHPNSDYSDNSLFHIVRIAGQGQNLRVQMEAVDQILRQFPSSDLADDALWFMASHVSADSDMADKAALLERLVRDYPQSGYVPRALSSLVTTYVQRQAYGPAVGAAQALVNGYPHADGAAAALLVIADRFRDSGQYADAIAAYNDLMNRYPFSDQADDSMFGIATCLRSQQAWRDAFEAYHAVLRRFPGSRHVPEVWRELNNRNPGQFDLSVECPCEIASRMFDTAEELRSMRRFAEAVSLYQQILRGFRGSDRYDDSLYNIGRCFEELDLLGMAITEASGPEDRYSRQTEWFDATGMRHIPEGEIAATQDAVSAYLLLANNFVGSDLRDDALHRIHELFKERKMAEEEAMACQQLLIGFPGSEFECEALYTVIHWYAEEATYPDCAQPYSALARTWPSIFPLAIADSEHEFRGMMKFYLRDAGLAYNEAEKKHIGYDYGPEGLMDDAALYLGNLQISYGKTREGARLLSQLLGRPQSDHAAAAYFCLGRANERLGRTKEAVEMYQRLLAEQPLSGLADDATTILAELSGERPSVDVSDHAACAEALVGKPVSTYDVYVGENVVVFCPFGYTALVRAYNLPNIWDTAQAGLAEWTGQMDRLAERQVIVLDTAPGAEAGNVVRLPVDAINDPPQWDVGLAQLAENFIRQPKARLVQEMGEPLIGGFVSVAAASLQYELVSETRDTIGNASAVKLPFENLIRQRDANLQALANYVSGGADIDRLDAGAASGMLQSVLDMTGQSRGLVDWSPFRRFFQAADECAPQLQSAQTERDRTAIFVRCMNEAFNTDLTPVFADWGFDIRPGDAPEVARTG